MLNTLNKNKTLEKPGLGQKMESFADILTPDEIEAILGSEAEAKTPEVKDKSRETGPEQKEALAKTARARPMLNEDQIHELEERVTHPRTKSERLARIESIMSQGLEEIFFTLNPTEQAKMRQEGETTATRIEKLFEAGKATAKKIWLLLRAWLAKFPGVNRFFLEQETKIRTDRILAMARVDEEKAY